MKVKQLIKILQKLPQNDEVLAREYEAYDESEVCAGIHSIEPRRIYDNDTKMGDRRVVLITIKEYGEEEFELIEE